jgi:hypothetical protein
VWVGLGELEGLGRGFEVVRVAVGRGDRVVLVGAGVGRAVGRMVGVVGAVDALGLGLAGGVGDWVGDAVVVLAPHAVASSTATIDRDRQGARIGLAALQEGVSHPLWCAAGVP